MATERTGVYGKYFGSIYTASEYLSENEMKTNVQYIYSYLTDKGWSLNAICGLFGNLQAESGFNAGIWQTHNIGNLDGGYGLVQWTPASKYFEWCTQSGLSDPSEMDNNLARIIYEVENGLQWIATDDYSFTFKEFTTSTASVSYLAKAFLLNYERPKDQSETKQNERANNAVNWYEYITGEEIDPSDPINPPSSGTTVSGNKRKRFNFILFNRRRRTMQ